MYGFQQIVDQLMVQKRFEKHRGQQFLDIMRKARKKQNIHEIFRNDDLANQTVRAGFIRR